MCNKSSTKQYGCELSVKYRPFIMFRPGCFKAVPFPRGPTFDRVLLLVVNRATLLGRQVGCLIGYPCLIAH
ncbi:hypothetical protein T08_3016 [Trichinella sp. T8]|nr:hypothetical protein T08_3016 [Trichinella sp. T8]